MKEKKKKETKRNTVQHRYYNHVCHKIGYGKLWAYAISNVIAEKKSKKKCQKESSNTNNDKKACVDIALH